MSERAKRELVENLLRRIAADASNDDDEDDRDDDEPAYQSKDMQARVLTDMLEVINAPCPFKVGDIVQQAREFRRYRYPGTKLALVTDVFETKLESENKNGEGSPVCRNDMKVLVQARKTWIEFNVESWRFKKYEGEIA